jgi:hypothetical protein
MKWKDWRPMMLNLGRHDRHRICEKYMGVKVARKGRNRIEDARGEGTLRETMREVAEKRL